MIQACGCPPSCEATGTPPPGGRLLRRCPVGCRRRSPRRVQLLLDSIGSVRSAVGPIASILGMAPGEARARGGATRNNDDVCALCHARTPGDPCRVCGHGSAATTDDAAAAAMVSGSAARHARRTRHRKRGLEARRRADMASTSLFDACKEGRSDVVRAWLNKGAEVDRANTWGETPLFVACQNDHREAARLLLEQGAEVDRADVDGRTPLFAACVKGQVDLARLLLGNGAEVDGPVSEGLYEGQTPLYVACGNGHVDAARLLLDKGAKVNRATRNGNTPLSIAKKNGHSAVVALLEEHHYPLHATAQTDEAASPLPDEIEPVFGRPRTPQPYDYTPPPNLLEALRGALPYWGQGAEDVESNAKSDVQNASDEEVNRVDPETGDTPLLLSAQYGAGDLVEMLVERGADVDITLPSGATALHYMTNSSTLCPDAVIALLAVGADPSVADLHTGPHR